MPLVSSPPHGLRGAGSQRANEAQKKNERERESVSFALSLGALGKLRFSPMIIILAATIRSVVSFVVHQILALGYHYHTYN